MGTLLTPWPDFEKEAKFKIIKCLIILIQIHATKLKRKRDSESD
jgi:hypothetical protein